MPRRIIGIDFRDEALTAAVLRQSLREIRVEDCVEVSLPAEPVPRAVDGLQRWVQPLSELVKQVPVSGADCVVGFPAHWASYRQLQMPFQTPKKIRQVLTFELEPLLPFAADETVADIQPGLAAPNGSSRTFSAVAAHKGQLEAFLAILEQQGLKPRIVSVGFAAAALALMECEGIQDRILVVDLDRANVNFCLVEERSVVTMRSLQVSAPTYPGKAGIAKALQHTLLAADGQEAPDKPISSVYVSGSGAGGSSLQRELAAALDAPVVPLQLEGLFPRLVSSGGKAPPPPSTQTALSLALSEIVGENTPNLRRGAFAESGIWARYRSSMIRSAVMLLLAAIAFSVNFGIDLARQQQRHRNLKDQIEAVFRSTFPDAQRVVDPEAQMQVSVREARQSLQRAGVRQEAFRFLDVLAEISRRVPPQLDVILDRLDISPEKVMLAGDTSNFNAVDDVKRQLEQSPLFRSVDINSTSKSKSGDRVEFKMTIETN